MCFFWNMPAGETADIYAQRVDLSGMSSAYVNFDVAYTPFTAATPENDKLEVMVSTDCGATWSTLYNKAGSTLQTAPVVGNGAANGWFKPDLASEWRAESVNLSSVVGQSDVMVRFKGTSGFGDNLFVDNINISNTAITGVEETVVSEFSIYPNPAVDVVNVSLNLTETSKVNIQVVNNLGQTVILRNLGELTGTSINQVDISSLASGVYMMNIVVNGNVTVKQFVKN
jgi:hypothetical protein